MGDSQGAHPEYSDPRTVCLDAAASFARSEGLLGISAHADPFAGDRAPELEQLAQRMRRHRMQLFTWGKANSSAEFAEFQRRAGVRGVIMDGVDEMADASRREPAPTDPERVEMRTDSQQSVACC